jgi:hypothetical protein
MNFDRSKIKELTKWAARQPRWRVGAALALAMFGSGVSAWALITDATQLAIVANVQGSTLSAIGGHIVQSTLTNQVVAGQNATAFATAFARGDSMFSSRFNGADGGGANVGVGERYTCMPRADLAGAGQWASHTPARQGRTPRAASGATTAVASTTAPGTPRTTSTAIPTTRTSST